MATTEVTYTQTGDSNKDFTVTFPFIKSTDVYVELGGVTKTSPTHFTLAGTTLTFQNNVLASSGTNTIRIYRNTNIDKAKATYQTGSSIRAQDLNDNTEQILYSLQERTATSSASPAATGLALTAGSKNHITVNSASDWTISGTGIVNSTMLSSDSVDSDELVNGSIDLAHMSANSVDSDQYVDGSIDHVHLANDIIDGDNIQDDVINSEHYVAASIDHEHLSNDAVDGDNLADNAVDSEHYTDGSIDTVHLATATITACSNPVGAVIWYAGSTAPAGYLKANGDAIANGNGTTQSITADFSTLYAIVGGNLPDLRGEFVRGFDDGKGTDSGRAIRSTQTDDFKNHHHKFAGDDWIGGSGGYTSLGGHNVDEDSSGGGNCADYRTKDDSSNSGGSETRPRNIALLACIKY